MKECGDSRCRKNAIRELQDAERPCRETGGTCASKDQVTKRIVQQMALMKEHINAPLAVGGFLDLQGKRDSIPEVISGEGQEIQ
jgi:hypothetical protein